MANPMPPRIDVHTHYLPKAYRKACQENGHANPDGMPYLPEWSPEAHLDLMTKHNISKSILSISSPGTHLVPGNNALAATVARECNAYAADLKKRMPDKFGYFASLPLPDIETCLKEIELGSKEGCDGFVVLTNGHGIYLGDKLYDPVFAELDRRHAILFIHPTTPTCPCSSPESQPTKATPFAGLYPNPMLEFLFDTARAVTHLFMSGTMRRSPNIQVILPHLGGAFPPLLSRWTEYSGLVPGPYESTPEDEVKATFLKQVYFDLAGFPFPGQIKGLMEGVGIPHERLLYGSDFPFTKANGVDMLVGKMDEGVKGMFSEEEIEGLYYKNAERMLSYKQVRP